MEHINIENLEKFISVPVEVAIQDENEQEQAPFVEKLIMKLQLCPEHTHLRIYFNSFYFLAVPLIACVIQTEREWIGYDKDAGLYYVIRRRN